MVVIVAALGVFVTVLFSKSAVGESSKESTDSSQHDKQLQKLKPTVLFFSSLFTLVQDKGVFQGSDQSDAAHDARDAPVERDIYPAILQGLVVGAKNTVADVGVIPGG